MLSTGVPVAVANCTKERMEFPNASRLISASMDLVFSNLCYYLARASVIAKANTIMLMKRAIILISC